MLISWNRQGGSLGGIFSEGEFVRASFFLSLYYIEGGSLDRKRRTKCILSSPKGLLRSRSWLSISVGRGVVWFVRYDWRGGGEGRGR